MHAQLGNIIFDGAKGFTSFKHKRASSISQHAIIDGKPKIQKTGDALDEISFEMMFHSSFCVPEDEITKVTNALINGEIMPLILGTGETLGNFVITECSNTPQHTYKDGSLIMTSVAVTLLESAETDNLGTSIAAAKSSAFSNAANSPNAVPYRENMQSKGLSASKSLSSANSLQTAGTAQLTLANSSPQAKANEVRKAKKTFEKFNDALDQFDSAVTSIQSSIASYEQIKATVETVKTYTQNVLSAIQSDNISGALSANRDLRTSLNNLNTQSSSMITQTATRRI